MTARPAPGEPVIDTIATCGCRTSASPTSASPVSTFSTPGGRPDSTASSASRSVVPGVCGDGFRTIVLPAARAGPSFQTAITSGKFHGAMPATTPSGRRISIDVKPRLSSPAPEPSSERAAPAKKRRLSMANGSSPSRNTATGLPVSATSSAVSSSASASIRSARADSACARSPAVRADHSPNAAAADSTADSASDSSDAR